MTANTGRTVKTYVDFIIGDSANTLRSIPVDTINGLDLTYDEVDLSAFQDPAKGCLLGQPGMKITIGGPFDTTAAQTVGTLSGSHTVLSALVGLNVPRTLDVHIGIQHAWTSGEPQFGISRSASSGFLVSSYSVDPGTGKYQATLVLFAGSALPAWGSSAES